MFLVKFEKGDEIKITEVQKELLCLQSSVIEHFTEDDVIIIPKYVSKKSFESIIRFIDMCPADFDHNFSKPIDKNEFHSKAWLFENWLQGMEKEDLFTLLNSANYLIIKSLIDLLCAYIALRIKYMTNEEMTDYFTI